MITTFILLALLDMLPLPGSVAPATRLLSPKHAETVASLGAPMVKALVSPTPAFVPTGFVITNLSLATGTVTIQWQQGQPLFQVQATSLDGAWSNVGSLTASYQKTFPEQPQHFFRIVQSNSLPLIVNSNSQPRVQWTVPTIDMSDSLGVFHLDRGTDGTNFTQDAVTGSPFANTVRQANDTTAPNPSLYYRLRQTTANGVVIPYNVGVLTTGTVLPITIAPFNQQPRINWSIPSSIPKSDLNPFKVQSRDCAPDPNQAFSDDTGWTTFSGGGFLPPGYSVGVDQSVPYTGNYYFSDQIVPNPNRYYRVKETTISGLNIQWSGSLSRGLFGLVNWYKSIQDGTQDKANALGAGVAIDSSGNVITGGSFNSYNTDGIDLGNGLVLGASNLLDCFITKRDVNGNTLWVIHFGGVLADSLSGISVDSQDNIIALVTFRSATLDVKDSTGAIGTTLTGKSGGLKSVAVIKYNQNGIFMWAFSPTGQALRNDSFISPCTLGIDNSDNILFAFTSEANTITFNNGKSVNQTPGSTGFQLGVAAKFSAGSQGNPGLCQWARSIGGDNQTLAPNGVACDGSGNMIACGYAVGPAVDVGGSTTVNTGGVQWAWLGKYSSVDGSAMWTTPHVYGNNTYIDVFNSISADPVTGRIYVTGLFAGTTAFGGTPLVSGSGGTATSIPMLGYQPDGSLMWQKAWGGEMAGNGDTGQVIKVTSGGDLALGGIMNSSMDFNNDDINAASGAGYFISLWTINGTSFPTYRWAKRDSSGRSSGICSDVSIRGAVVAVTGLETGGFNPGCNPNPNPVPGTAAFTVKYNK